MVKDRGPRFNSRTVHVVGGASPEVRERFLPRQTPIVSRSRGWITSSCPEFVLLEQEISARFSRIRLAAAVE